MPFAFFVFMLKTLIILYIIIYNRTSISFHPKAAKDGEIDHGFVSLISLPQPSVPSSVEYPFAASTLYHPPFLFFFNLPPGVKDM